MGHSHLMADQDDGDEVGRIRRRDVARQQIARPFKALLQPAGVPDSVSEELEETLAGVRRELGTSGPGRLRRVGVQLRDAPPQLLERLSRLVVEHPGVVYDRQGVEELAERQSRSISAAVGALQLALITGAAATTLEGGPLLALGIDAAVGQVAAVVTGACDWYTVASYLVHRLASEGLLVEPREIRALTTAALMTKRGAIQPEALGRSTELKLLRGWVGHGVIDALPMGARLGRSAVRAVDRIDESELPRLMEALRAGR